MECVLEVSDRRLDRLLGHDEGVGQKCCAEAQRTHTCEWDTIISLLEFLAHQLMVAMQLRQICFM